MEVHTFLSEINCYVCRSHPVFRAFYIPFLSAGNTVYSEYVLLLSKQKFKNVISKLTPEYDATFI